MIRFKHQILLICAVCGFIFATGCSENQGYDATHASGIIWGTAYNITYNPHHVVNQEEVMPAVSSALNEVDKVANAFSPVSEISQLNANGSLDNPSPLFLYLLETSASVNAESFGAFDPTIAPLVNLWGFGSGSSMKNPTDMQIDSISSLVNFNNISYTKEKISFTQKGMSLDFGAIAKGVGVDRVADALSQNGIKHYMVEIGGEVRVAGTNPRGERWSVQLDAPIRDDGGAHYQLLIMELADAAVATSGNYRNFRQYESGKLLYHTISPVTGRPVQTEILSASVIARQTAVADALATASMVMGLQKASEMIERLCKQWDDEIFGAIFITDSGNESNPFMVHQVELDQNHVKIR